MQEIGDDALLREGWEDIIPVHEDEGLAPVVRIRSSGEDAATMDLFHAVLGNGELSERVLALTEEVTAPS